MNPLQYLGLSLACATMACSAVGAVDSVIHARDGRCTDDGDVSLERVVTNHPSCDGAKHRDECSSAGAPSVYGVDEGCDAPFLSWDDVTCHVRPGGLAGCIILGSLRCCP